MFIDPLWVIRQQREKDLLSLDQKQTKNWGTQVAKSVECLPSALSNK